MGSERTITAWEYDELLDHLNGRPDIWERNAENELLWLRSLDGRPVMAIAFSEEEGGMRTVDPYSVEWDEGACEEYLDELLDFWTERRRRILMEEVLGRTIGLDARTAEQLAVVLLRAEHELDPEDPERAAPPPVQEPLFPAGFVEPQVVRRRDPSHIGIWAVKAGLPSQQGTVHLRLRGGMISVELSLPTPDGSGCPVLKGFVSPTSGNIEDAVRRLRGETTDRAAPVREEGVSELQAALGLEPAGEP